MQLKNKRSLNVKTHFDYVAQKSINKSILCKCKLVRAEERTAFAVIALPSRMLKCDEHRIAAKARIIAQAEHKQPAKTPTPPPSGIFAAPFSETARLHIVCTPCSNSVCMQCASVAGTQNFNRLVMFSSATQALVLETQLANACS